LSSIGITKKAYSAFQPDNSCVALTRKKDGKTSKQWRETVLQDDWIIWDMEQAVESQKEVRTINPHL
jgi:hypothetical protein